MNEQKNIAHSTANAMSEKEIRHSYMLAERTEESKYFWKGLGCPYDGVIIDEFNEDEYMMERCGFEFTDVHAPDYEEFYAAMKDWFYQSFVKEEYDA